MTIYYVDWWSEEVGQLRRHFRSVGAARKFVTAVRKISSGQTVLSQVEFKGVKDDFVIMLDIAAEPGNRQNYPAVVRINTWPPGTHTKKEIQNGMGKQRIRGRAKVKAGG